MSVPGPLTVVIPTHDRAPTLEACLGALLAQRDLPPGLDIVVVDDGSADDTGARVEAIRRAAAMPIEYVRQPQRGPAAARNNGIERARGDLILFLGDDILAAPTLVREHLDWHACFPGRDVAVLGYVTWLASVGVTPYMRWLEQSGNQFDYGSLEGREDADPARFLYTANVSFKRALFEETGERFDERFGHALLEDIDLGRRLAARGLQLKYNPAAIGYHDHAIRLRQYARRIELSSEYWVLLERKRAAAQAPVTRAPGGAEAGGMEGHQARGRRDHGAYARYLARVAGEVVRNWPFWWIAQYCERRCVAPRAFERAHRYWAQRGLLRLEAKRAMALLRGRRAAASGGSS